MLNADVGAEFQGRDVPCWTISIVNQFGYEILAAHNKNYDAPDPVRGNLAQGALSNGAADYIAVLSGWAGNIPIVRNGGRSIVGDESKIKASFVTQSGTDALFDINISCVDGFSLHITCSVSAGMIAGCSKYLCSLNNCPDDNGVGSCRNPMRNDGWPATTFFAPCQRATYAYAHDDRAITGKNVCSGDTVICYVGTKCPSNPRQSAQVLLILIVHFDLCWMFGLGRS